MFRQENILIVNDFLTNYINPRTEQISIFEITMSCVIEYLDPLMLIDDILFFQSEFCVIIFDINSTCTCILLRDVYVHIKVIYQSFHPRNQSMSSTMYPFICTSTHPFIYLLIHPPYP